MKFLQLTSPYWKDYAANWTMLGYKPPPGCDIVPMESKLTEFCEWDALQVSVETSHWSRSLETLCSDWLRSQCCYASSLMP